MKNKGILVLSCCLLLGGALSLSSCNNNNNATIVDKTVESISTSVSNISLVEEETTNFSLTFSPADAVNKEVVLSYDETIIKVETSNENSYKVTALKEGSTEINITLKSDSTIKTSIAVVVTKKETVVLPTSISTLFSRKILGINEEIQLNVEFYPLNTTAKQLRYISSNPSAISISSSGLVKGVAKGEAVITISSMDAPDIVPITLSLSCTDDVNLVANDKISASLDSAIENEQTDIVSGEINITHKSRNDSTESTFTNSYQSYQGAIYNNIVDFASSDYLLYYGFMDSQVYEVKMEDNEYTEQTKYNVSEDGYFSGDITQAEADTMINLPAMLPYSYSSSYVYGVGNFVQEYLLDSIFMSTTNIGSTIINTNENIYTFNLTKVGYDYVEIYSLQLVFENDNFASVSYKYDEYYDEYYDVENGVLLEGATSISYDRINIILTTGEKVKENDPLIEPMDFYYQDFDIAFRTTSEEIGTNRTTFNVNDNITFDVLSALPDTASSIFDRIEIVDVSNPEVIEISANKLAMFAHKSGSCDVTIASKYTTKTYTLNVVVPELESLSFSSGLTDTLASNEYVTFLVELNPSGALDDIVVEIESGSEYATLGMTDYGYYYLSGNPEMTDKEGIVVLKAYSESRPEISVTKEIKVIKVKTASEIRDILLSKTYVATLSDFYNSQASLKFNDDNSGVFTLLNQNGSLFDEAHFTWVVSATGNISMADITYTNGYISEFSVAFNDPEYQKLEGSFVDEVESDDEYGSTIYFEFM